MIPTRTNQRRTDTDQPAKKWQNRPVQPDRPLAPHTTHISCLPPEILLTLFRFLSVPARGRVAQVCSGWQNAVYDKSVWFGTVVTLDKRMQDDIAVVCARLAQRGVRRLATREGDVLAQIAYHLSTTLLSLHLTNYTQMRTAWNDNLLCQIPNLTELNLSHGMSFHVRDNTIELIARHIKKLVSLYLIGIFHLTDVSLHHIATGLPKLKRLQLDRGLYLTNVGIGYLCGRGPVGPTAIPALEYLRLRTRYNRLSDLSLQYLREAQPNLQKLELWGLFGPTNVGFDHLAGMPNLHTLQLLNCTTISESGLASLANGGSKVITLDLACNHRIPDGALEHIGRLTHLQDLNLSGNLVNNSELKLLVKSESRLTTLCLSNCENVRSSGMVHVAKLTNLQHLMIYGTRVGDDGLAHLAQGATRLTSIQCSTDVTDIGLGHLATLPHLTAVDVISLNVTSKGLMDLVAGLGTKLTILKLTDCPGLCNRTLLLIAQGFMGLDTLELNWDQVDEEGLAAAAANLPYLRTFLLGRKNAFDMVHALRNGISIPLAGFRLFVSLGYGRHPDLFLLHHPDHKLL